MPHMTSAALTFAREVAALRRPMDVVDVLDRRVRVASLHACAIWRWPRLRDRMQHYVEGENLFWHGSVPAGLRRDLMAAIRMNGPIVPLAMLGPGPLTWTEAMHKMQPTGNDGWVIDLFRKYGLRDGLLISYDQWEVVFCSPGIVRMTAADRAAVNVVGEQAAARLEELLGRKLDRKHKMPELTRRELSVLEHLSFGEQITEIAKTLGIKQPTARTFLRRAQRKLHAKTPLHAVATAMRARMMR